MTFRRPDSSRLLRFAASLTIMLTLAVTAGCSKNQFPVEGKVTYKDGRDGKKLIGAMVLFEPLEGGKVASSRGYVRADGRYSMGTLADVDGVAPGKYKVLVLPPAIENPERPPPGWPPLKDLYSQMDKSPFETTVERKHNSLDLAVD